MDGAAARRREQVRPGPSTTGRAVAVLAAAALAVVLWGGYGRGWRWTGFEHRAMLWDWLHELVLPLAVTVTPLWLRHRDRLGRKRHLLLGTFVAAFGIVVVLQPVVEATFRYQPWATPTSDRSARYSHVPPSR